MASIPFLLPHEMLEVIAQANPETIEAFVDANIQEPQLKATATEWAEMFPEEHEQYHSSGPSWRWGALCSQNYRFPGTVVLEFGC
jgi:hypothetical protein